MHFSEANFVASMRDPLAPLLSCACGCKFMIHALITEPHKSISLNKKKCLLLQLSLLLFIKKPSAKSNREPSLSCLPAVPKLFSIIWIRWEDSNSEFMMILFLERFEMKWTIEIWIYWRVYCREGYLGYIYLIVGRSDWQHLNTFYIRFRYINYLLQSYISENDYECSQTSR